MVDHSSESRLQISRLHAWPTLRMLIAAHVIFNLLLNPFGLPVANTWWSYLIDGVVFMQPILLGIWAAIGPGTAARRTPLVLAVFLLVALAGCYKQWNLWTLGYLNTAPGAMPVGALESLVGLSGTFATSALWAWVLDTRASCKIVRVRSVATASVERIRFSLKYLLAFVTVCAALLALARGLAYFAPPTGQFSWGRLLLRFFLVPLIVEFILFPPSVLSAFLILQHVRFRHVVAFLLGAVLMWLLVTAIMSATTLEPRAETFANLCSVQAGAAIAGLFTTFALRLAGYRLMRASDFVGS